MEFCRKMAQQQLHIQNKQFFYYPYKEMMNADRNKIKVILPTKNLTFAHKRLLKDIQQIENDPIPLCGVTARPLETNIFVWHANLRGPKKSRFQGGVFHIQIRFPQSYPSHPPTIRALSHILHPNVFVTYFCLDFLNLSKDRHSYSSYEWTPNYSVQSILYQLQGFLRNQNFPYDEAPILSITSNSNLYRCGECKHKGAADPWPTFDENDTKVAIYHMSEESLKLECSQLKCFYTKLNFTENQLGLGLKISKIPKTGLIKDAIIFQDFISIKAFLKQRINITPNKGIISHWLPLYFGKVDCHQKFFYLLKKSLSMIMTNSTKYFKPEYILQVFPKILINLVYQLMDRKKYLSISLIRIFTYIHSIFLYCIKQHPQLLDIIRQSLKKFKHDQEYRNKDHTPNLGCFLAYLLITDQFQFSDIIQQYFGQQLDRHVFWILQGVPQLISPQLSQNADSVRNQLAFNCQKTSFHIICFYKLFLSYCSKRPSKIELLQQYEDNLCRFKIEQENQLQNQIFDIFKKVKSFSDYFRFVGLQEKSEEQVNHMLRQAIRNSEIKGYHSRQDIIKWEQRMNLVKTGANNFVSESPNKIDIWQEKAKYYGNIPSYQKYIRVKFPSKDDENSIQQIEYTQHESKEEDWKQLCLERWVWIKQSLTSDNSLEAEDISRLAFEFYKKGTATTGQRLYKLHAQYQKVQNNQQPTVPVPSVSWKQLFLRLDLQDFLRHIDIGTDFPKFYQKLYICCINQVNTLLIPLIEIYNLKSGYFYITALLSRLTTLRYIEFVCLEDDGMKLHEKLAKAIGKGLHNFFQKKGKLQFISFINVNAEVDISDHLFKKGYFSSSIKVFRIQNSNLLAFPSAIKHFTSLSYPDLQQISIKKCKMSSSICKTLADLLVKLKKLKIFRMNNEHNLEKGLSNILSNLAFNSTVRVIDIGETTICDSSQTNYIIMAMDDFIENLGKLIKINSNLEHLFLNDMPRLNQSLKLYFWQNLGLSIGLRVLDISSKTPNNSLVNKLQSLGRAVGFNGKKKGSLQSINFSGCISGFQSLEQFYKGMMISEYDEQEWYGSPNKLKDMIPQNYGKVFYNRLHVLNLVSCSNLDMPFSLKEHQQLINAECPPIVKLMTDSQQLHTLNMKNTGLTAHFANLLYLALDQNSEGLRSQLKVLNLSANLIGSEGACTLASILRDNRILEVLDLSKTGLGVSGIHKISTSLSENPSLRYLNIFNNNIGFDGAKSIAENIVTRCNGLQFLEIGHNRIRSKGLAILIDRIVDNKESRIKILGLRFNFLSNTAIINSIRKLAEAGNYSLSEIFVRNNLIDDFGVRQLREIVDSHPLRLSIDILDKSKFLDKQRADKTVWIYPINTLTIHQFKNFFENIHECGIIINIRIRTGKQIPNKKGDNKFCFVQFASAQSASAALSLAANNLTQINGVKFRVFKSGSGTFIYRKKPAKWVKREEALLRLPQIGLPVPHARQKKTAVSKAKKVAVNLNNAGVIQADLKCEERYLDQIKPLSTWRKKLAWGILFTTSIIVSYIFLWPGVNESIPAQGVALV